MNGENGCGMRERMMIRTLRILNDDDDDDDVCVRYGSTSSAMGETLS